MQDTLAALHAAVIDAPTDRTVRLVYADALDESGDPANAPRAAFIRAHVQLESLPDADPRRPALAACCDELFAAHWIDWWRPVCAAMGLPEPYVPKRRSRNAKRPAGAPYNRPADSARAYSIHSAGHGFTAQFIAGFPELLYFHPAPPDAGPELFARWAAAAPIARLQFGSMFNDAAGDGVDGPHLAKVTELAFDRLSAPAAATLARSPHLAALTTLKALALTPAADVVRALVSRPTWAKLRSLTLAGVTPPDAIRTLAEHCTLEELESLSFGIREVPEVPAFGGLTGAIGAMFTGVLSMVLGNDPTQPGPIRWPDYWPALEALARAPMFRRLRTLQLTDGGAPAGTLGAFVQQLRHAQAPATPDDQFPTTLVRALAAGLAADTLVRLELPAARVSPAGAVELARRFGPRLVLT